MRGLICVVATLVACVMFAADASAQCGASRGGGCGASSGCGAGGCNAGRSQGCQLQQNVQRARPQDLLQAPVQQLPPAPKAAPADDDDTAGIFRRGRRSGGSCGKGGCRMTPDEALFAVAPVRKPATKKSMDAALFAAN